MSDIHTKIRNLIAKAESSTHEGEVENCMRLVDALLAKHSLTLADIQPEDLLVVLERDCVKVHDSISWGRILFSAVAQYYGCKVVQTKRGYVYHMTIAGRRGNIETVKLMWPFILSQLKREAKRYAAEQGMTQERATRQIANALSPRIWSMIRMTRKAEGQAVTDHYAVVPVDEIDALFQDAFGNLRKGKPTTARYENSARDAAERVSMNRQAANGGATLRLSSN